VGDTREKKSKSGPRPLAKREVEPGDQLPENTGRRVKKNLRIDKHLVHEGPKNITIKKIYGAETAKKKLVVSRRKLFVRFCPREKVKLPSPRDED